MATCSKHVVLVPFPAQGHHLPMVYFAKKLAKRGFAVTLVNIDSIHETISMSKGWKNDDIRLECIPMELKLFNGVNAEDDMTGFCQALWDLEVPLAKLLANLNAAHTISCVIADFFHFSAPYAAAKAGIPCASFWPTAATTVSLQLSYDLLVDAGLVPVDDSNANNIVSIVPGLKPFKAEGLPFYFHEHLGNPIIAEFFAHLAPRRQVQHLDTWIFINSCYELERDVFDALQDMLPGKFVPVGPLFELEGGEISMELSLRPENRECLTWLDKHSPKSVLYVAFGSTLPLAQAEFEELTKGLEASNQPFLLVASRKLVSDLRDDFLDEFAERTARSGAGMVVSWAPQLAVLQHQAVGGFLTHCGWGSVLESLSNGVPMLGWPRGLDHNTDCKVVEELGIGIELHDKSSDGVRKAIVSFMTDEEMRAKSEKVKLDARAAAVEGGSSYKTFQTFYQSLA